MSILRFTALFAAALVPLDCAWAVTNGLALTPPMGWNSWNHFQCNISETVIKSMADAMATNGMRAAGYQFINIDDCWQTSRDSNGVIVADPQKFPSGIKALADYVHSKGLKLGIYSDHGTGTCQGRPGSYGYEYLDALTYAAWGVDYLKYDNCGLPPGDSTNVDDFKMAAALAQSGRPIVYSLCDWSFSPWMADCGNLWRTTADITDSFSSAEANASANSPMAFLAGPGHWNDPDMLEIGNGGMTTAQYQSQFTLWCISAAPLIAGNNLTNMSPQTLAILTNSEAIAVDQDSAGEQGVQVAGNLIRQTWARPLGTGFTAKALALVNAGGNSSFTVNWTNIGLQPGPATVRDLWTHANLGTFTNTFTTNVAAGTTVMLTVVGTAPNPPPVGTVYLTDLQAAYAYTGSGAVALNKSAGGNALTLNGVPYARGLGVNAYSGVEYRLAGLASRFQAQVGVDDEAGAAGSVDFQVFADGLKIFDSGLMLGGAPHQSIDLDVTGVNRLTLGVNDGGDGNASDHADWADAKLIVNSATPSAPLIPGDLSAAQGNPIVLTWSAVPGAAAYNVKRSDSATGPFATISTAILPAYADTDLLAGAAYYYSVSSVGKLGESSNSTAAGALACAALTPPTALTASFSGTNVVLNWIPVPGATSYTVARATSSTPYATLASGIAAAAFTDSNRTPGAIYDYAVAANNGCSQSAFSTYAFASTNVTLGVWRAGGSVILNWPLGTLQASTNAAGPYTNILDATLPYTNTAAMPQQFYRVRVK